MEELENEAFDGMEENVEAENDVEEDFQDEF